MIDINGLNKLVRAPLGARASSPNIIAPEVGAAMVSAGANLIGGLFGKSSTDKTNEMNLQIARENNIANQKLWQQEADFTREMWNAQNEYNTPSAQKQRYLDAGINPAFAMSNISSGSAASVSTPQHAPAQGATMQAPDYGFIGDAANGAIQTYANVAKLENELKIGAEEVRKSKAEADITENNAIYQDAWNKQQLAHLISQTYLSDEQRASSKVNRYVQQKAFNDIVRSYQLSNENIEKQMSLTDANMKALQIQNKAAQLKLDNLPKEIALNLSLLGEKIKSEMASQNMSFATAKNMIQQSLESQARTRGINISNWQADNLAWDIVTRSRQETINWLNTNKQTSVSDNKAIQFFNTIFGGLKNAWSTNPALPIAGDFLHLAK